MHFGIDYGSKLAGTTVICFAHNKHLEFIQSEKKQDADENKHPKRGYVPDPSACHVFIR